MIGWHILAYLSICVVAYLLGSISSAVIVSRKLFHQDIREYGSGNAGLTNTLRVYGGKAALLTLIGDMAKAAGGVWFAKGLMHFAFGYTPEDPAYLWAGCLGAYFVIAGHIKPLWFEFRGGKGVLTTVASWLFIDWRIAAICFVLFVIVVGTTKYVSLGSVLGMVCFLVCTLIFGLLGAYASLWPPLIFSAVISSTSIFMHRSNMVRLINGTENKLGQRSKEKAEM